MDVSFRIAKEEIQRAALVILNRDLNAKIDSLAADWAAKDAAFFTAMGQSNPNFTVEHVPAANMHAGTIPSLVATTATDGEPANYPNLCSIAYLGRPRGTSDDEAERYAVTLALEFMVKSHTSEQEVNARIQRTLEAAHAVMVDNQTLGNLVVGINPPDASIGEVWVLRNKHDSHKRLFWQGGSLQYTVDKYVDLTQG